MSKEQPTTDIYRWVWNTLDEVSDETGTETNGEYLLVYEGWGSICVSEAFDQMKSCEEIEDSSYHLAEVKSNEVINEWVEIYKDHLLIDSGHEPTGLYGVTWALFKKTKSKSNNKYCKTGNNYNNHLYN
jgi:hypothetical protein